jgi:hypothetical protein
MVEQNSPANLMDVLANHSGPLHVAHVFPKETKNQWTIEIGGMPAFEVSARHPGAFPSPATHITLTANENGLPFHERKPSKTVSSHSYFEQSNAAHKWMKEWYDRVNNPEPERKRFSVRSHRRGATLIYHTGIANVEIEFRSQRLARVHGKRYTLNFTHSF